MSKVIKRPASLALIALAHLAALPARAEDVADPRWQAQQMMDDLMWNRGPIGGPFALRDTEGRPRGDRDFRGKVVALYFGYTHCPDVCPTDLMAITQAIDALGVAGDDVQPVFVTIDPARDTPAELKDYARAFHPRLVALTGTPDEIRRVANAYKASYTIVTDPGGDVRVDHSGVIYFLGRDGSYRGFAPPQSEPARLAEIMKRLLAAGDASPPAPR